MCLIVFSFRSHPGYPLIFAGNRDEFHRRPSAPAHFWDEDPDLLAGRDLRAGGTWLGVSRSGRFATVTNFREPGEHRSDARSRGELVTGFLRSDVDGLSFLMDVHERAQAYNGFNLILGEERHLYYLSNRNGAPRTLDPGIYGLSNGWLETPWPKVRRAKALLKEQIDAGDVAPEALLGLLRDESRPPDDELPRTGLDVALERKASSIFIADPTYGTRASTVVLMDRDSRVTFVERSFGPDGHVLGTESFRFAIDSDQQETPSDASPDAD